MAILFRFHPKKAVEAAAMLLKLHDKIKDVTLTQVGYGLLGDYLRSPDFEFEGTQIDAKMGNYLVKWIAGVPTVAIASDTSTNEPKLI